MPEINKNKTKGKLSRFKPGQSGNPNGRPKGSPNKITTSVKQAFVDAFENMGGVEALEKWAKKEPGEFYKLYAKLIPLDVTSGGEPLTSIEVTVVKNNT